MYELEKELRTLLNRKEPPPGFSGRVMARIPGARPSFFWRWASVATAASVLIVFSVGQYRDYRQGQQAKEQLLLALEITAEKLAVCESKVRELNNRSIP